MNTKGNTSLITVDFDTLAGLLEYPIPTGWYLKDVDTSRDDGMVMVSIAYKGHEDEPDGTIPCLGDDIVSTYLKCLEEWRDIWWVPA